MRVLVYTNLFPSRANPIRGVYSRQGFRALARWNDVRVVCPVDWRARMRAPRALFRAPVETWTGLTTELPTYWSIPRLVPALNAHILYWSTRRTVRRLSREFAFDAILAAWGYPDAVAAMRFAREAGRPLVVNLLGSDLNDLAQRSTLRPAITRALRQSAAVIVLSRAMAEGVAALGVRPERIVVQHNGVDQDLFRIRDRESTRRRLGLPEGRPVVLAVGNLVPVKGPDVLIEAFAQLAADHASGTMPLLVLVGDGPMRPTLEETVRRRGLAPHVFFCGRRPHEDVADWLGAADVLCLASRTEGCPNVVIEALASGRPVVASAVGGAPELVPADGGILVPPDRPAALAAGLSSALTRGWEPDRLRRSVAHLTWEEFGRTFDRVLREATCSAARGPA